MMWFDQFKYIGYADCYGERVGLRSCPYCFAVVQDDDVQHHIGWHAIEMGD